jgi:presenilin-like A22 family membrane protease
MKAEEKVFTFLLILTVFTMLILTFGYHSEARLVPLLVGICTLVFMVLLGIMAISTRFAQWYQKLEGRSLSSLTGRSEESQSPEGDVDPLNHSKKGKSVIGWLLFLTASTYIFGFLVAIPVFLFLFLKLRAKEGWVLSLCLSAAVTGTVYLVFALILHVPLHRGILY